MVPFFRVFTTETRELRYQKELYTMPNRIIAVQVCDATEVQ
jgi:hypothetical protein